MSVTISGSGQIVKQVVSTEYQTEISLTSSTPAEITGLTTSITPTSSTSKILFTGTLQVGHNTATGGYLQLYRGSTLISRSPAKWFYFGSSANDVGGTCSFTFLDSPATTSAVSYKVYWACDNGAQTIYLNRTATNTANEKGASQIVLMEISGS